MEDAWKNYAADFDGMTDEQIERECEESREKIAEHEDWLEAVASWEAAGKPRNAGHAATEGEGANA